MKSMFFVPLAWLYVVASGGIAAADCAAGVSTSSDQACDVAATAGSALLQRSASNAKSELDELEEHEGGEMDIPDEDAEELEEQLEALESRVKELEGGSTGGETPAPTKAGKGRSGGPSPSGPTPPAKKKTTPAPTKAEVVGVKFKNGNLCMSAPEDKNGAKVLFKACGDTSDNMLWQKRKDESYESAAYPGKCVIKGPSACWGRYYAVLGNCPGFAKYEKSGLLLKISGGCLLAWSRYKDNVLMHSVCDAKYVGWKWQQIDA